MTPEPTTTPIEADDDAPATKGFVRQENAKLKAFIVEQIDELRRYFDVLAENIHRDVAGANHDEISAIQDRQQGHEERIGSLERQAGLPVGG